MENGSVPRCLVFFCVFKWTTLKQVKHIDHVNSLVNLYFLENGWFKVMKIVRLLFLLSLLSLLLLVGGLEHFLFSHILGIIIPID